MNCSEYIPSTNNHNRIKTPALLLLTLLLFGSSLFAQDVQVPTTSTTQPGYKCRAEIVNGDTVPVVDLYDVYVYTEFVFRNNRQREQWTRIKHNVKKVYPYAILAAAKLKEYDRILEHMPDEKMKKAYLRVCEKDLKNQFEDELKDLSINQGRVLMKLIDRETGKTTYEIVKEMRGGFEACMWQAVARIFGNNMKDEYDANIEDIMIERAIKIVESGQF
ncbi:MAG: DUF4294 domain-containing protein [Sphingobacteriaceae bacterium]|nr:DUF4294 domain-containing protein [Sphingobacteriaceae bacterium]